MYKEKLLNSCVGVAGCGGLGSNCAVALARIGVGHIVIADFDVIVQSNLNRQYFFYNQIGQKKVFALRDNINNINPDVLVDAHDIKLSPESIISLFQKCDIIIEAFDFAEMKQMLIETVLTEFPDKYLIAGVGLAGWGNNNTIKTERFDKLFICGDQQIEVCQEFPPLAPRVGIVANMQANQAMEIIINELNK